MPDVECLICRKKFYVKLSHQNLGFGKYCSIECRSKSQLKGEIVTCHICSKKTYRSLAKIKHSKSGNFFCSKSCQTQWRNSHFIAEKHPNWLGGTGTYRKILERTGLTKKCFNCDLKDARVLIAHHIDHNRKNNDLSNLVWVCLNCHHLIHNYQEIEQEFKRKVLTLKDQIIWWP